ncbi:MAG: NAD(P)H-binding protein [Gammaproteobacteria bacterium]
MTIALIGATGFVGTAVLNELLAREHQVTALVRHPTRLDARPRLEANALDVYDTVAVTNAVRGHDAVVSAFNPG